MPHDMMRSQMRSDGATATCVDGRSSDPDLDPTYPTKTQKLYEIKE
jgi:hypothetical protein